MLYKNMKKILVIFSLLTALSYSNKIILSPTFNINYDKSKLDIEVKYTKGSEGVGKEQAIENQKKRDRLAKRMSFGFGLEAKYDLSDKLNSDKLKLSLGTSINSEFDYFNLKSDEVETSEHEPAIINKKIYFNGLVELGYVINEDFSLFSGFEIGPGVHIYNYPEYEPVHGQFHTSIDPKTVFSFNTALKSGISYKNFKFGTKMSGNFTKHNYEFNKLESGQAGNVNIKLDMFKIGGFISYDFEINRK